MFHSIFIALIAFAGFYGIVAKPVNLYTGNNVTLTWLETGNVLVSSDSWASASTISNNFTNPVVLVSQPDVPGQTSTSGFPTSIRVKNIVTSGGYTSFQAKVYLTNDSFCSTTWYVAEPFLNKDVSFIVIERGAYNLKYKTFNYYMFVYSGAMTRARATVDNTIGNGDYFEFAIPGTCVGISQAPACGFPATDPLTTITAATQIQTLTNDRFLMVRAFVVRRLSIVLLLVPHDSLDSSYYVVPNAETVGIFQFYAGMQVNCVEGIQFESFRVTGITNAKTSFTLSAFYTTTPGVYGMLVSTVSVVDSTGIRVFDRTTTGFNMITQEDKCANNQTDHTTPETAGLFVAGPVVERGSFTCGIHVIPFPSAIPTSAPTRTPTRTPTSSPTHTPTSAPTFTPTSVPTSSPTHTPTSAPTFTPTSTPTSSPTHTPTSSPTSTPTLTPTSSPTATPTFTPTAKPTTPAPTGTCQATQFPVKVTRNAV